MAITSSFIILIFPALILSQNEIHHSAIQITSEENMERTLPSNQVPCTPYPNRPWVDHWKGHAQNVSFSNDPLQSKIAPNVKLYFDTNISCKARWILEFIDQVWTYMNTTYGEFGKNPSLYVVIHQGQYPGSRVQYSLDPKIKFHRNILDVGSSKNTSWISNSSRNEEMDLLVNKLANFVEFSSKSRFGSPSYNVWKKTMSNDTAWADIFTYDVYTNLSYTYHAKRYKKKIFTQKDDFLRKNETFWLRDWFLPIYEKYGGNFVLNNYFDVMHDLLPNKVKSMNIGKFVHFWSGAAQDDLSPLAKNVFFWSEVEEKQLLEAKRKYGEVSALYNMVADEDPGHDDGHVELDDVIKWACAGAGGFCVVIIVLVVYIGFNKKKIHNLKTEIRGLTAAEVKEFFEGNPNAKFTSEEDEAIILAMPFIKDYEIAKDQIIIAHDRVLGNGQFGSVVHGFVRLVESNELVPVAIKIAKPNVDVMYFKAFLFEVKIMAFLGKHENIVQLLGTCTANIKEREICIALELCPLGNLEDYLKNNRRHFQIKAGIGCLKVSGGSIEEFEMKRRESDSNKFSIVDLLKWSHNISNAMVYVMQKKIIHGDIAARNVLLSANRTAKICDFGLARQVINYANYIKTSKIPVPWRWLAVECIKERTFSTASDVWAFGVLLWEIFSLGETPYGLYTYDLSFVDKLINGERLLRPPQASRQIYQLMQDCWKILPKDRVTFTKIHETLGDLISSYSNVNLLASSSEDSSNTSSCVNEIGECETQL